MWSRAAWRISRWRDWIGGEFALTIKAECRRKSHQVNFSDRIVSDKRINDVINSLTYRIPIWPPARLRIVETPGRLKRRQYHDRNPINSMLAHNLVSPSDLIIALPAATPAFRSICACINL